MKTDLSERLAIMRIDRQLTQKELAEKVGWQPINISHFETGRRTPSLKSLVRLCEALGCTPNELLGYEDWT